MPVYKWGLGKSAAVIAAVALLQMSNQASSMSANPMPFNVTQPDGTSVLLQLMGNEYRNYLIDKSTGYVVLESNTGPNATMQYTYAISNPTTGGTLASSGVPVGSIPFTTSASGIPTLASGEVLPFITEVAPSVGWTQLGLEHTTLASLMSLDNDYFMPSANTTEQSGGPRLQRRTSTIGAITNLVVMIRWSDSPLTTRTDTTPGLPTVQDLNTIFNGPSNSVKDVYLQNSYGRLTINSVFTDWLTVSVTEAQAAGGSSGLSCCSLQDALTKALQAADQKIDFSQFDGDHDGVIDMISFLHSGYGAEWGGANGNNRIWSHKWALPNAYKSAEGPSVSRYFISPALWGVKGTEMGHIGVIAHESGHFLGLPDLYDTDGPGFGSGLGSYSLMANSWGFDFSQNFPPLMDAWSKINLGWVQPTVITTKGTYVANAVATSPQIYKITQNFPAGEYLLIENRQPMGYDQKMPQGGICIYHIDESAGLNSQGYPGQPGWPQNGNHYKVALLQADGLYQLESTTQRGDGNDVWYAGGKNVLGPDTVPSTDAYQRGIVANTGITITITSPPGSQMTFQVDFGLPPSPPPTGGTTTSGPTATDPGNSRPSLSIRSLQLRQAKVVASKANSPVRGIASARVTDQNGKYLGKVKVFGQFYRAHLTPMTKYSATGTTVGTKTQLGTATLRTAATWASVEQAFWFCVTSVQLTGYTYNQLGNTVTCISAKGEKRKDLVFGTQGSILSG